MTDPQPAQHDGLSLALALAAQGFRVFPLIADGRLPAIGGWQHRATTDPEVIRTMFTSFDPVFKVERRPAYNVGIATGQFRDGFLCVVDVDVKKGARGRESLEALDMAAPDDWLDGVKKVETLSGGDHLFFFSAEPLATTASKIAPGIDTRGVGGFVVAEGSTIGGRSYRDCGGVIKPAPQWLAAAIGAPVVRADTNNVLCILDTQPALDRATSWLRDNSPSCVQGARGSTAYRVAAAVKDFGVSELACQELMVEHWNETHSVPPMAFEELTTSVNHAYRYGVNPIGIRDPTADFEAWDEEIPKTPKAPNRFRLERFGSIAPDLKRRDLIKGVLLRVATLGVIGAPGSGKSQLEAHLGVSIAAGLPWCGHKTMKGAVICALGEGVEGFRGRVQAIREAQGLPELPFFLVPLAPNLMDKKDVVAFVEICKEAVADCGEPLRIIFIDTLTTATPGMDQNSIEGMSRVVSALRYISRELDCVAATIHHVGKDAAKGARGSSVFNGDLDTELLVEVTGASSFTVKQSKQRDFEKGLPFRFHQRSAVIGQDIDGDDVTAVYAEHDDSPDAPDGMEEETRLTKQEQTMCGLLLNKPGWIGREWLREAFVDRWMTDNPESKRPSVASNFRRVVLDLIDRGLVVQAGEDRTAAYKLSTE